MPLPPQSTLQDLRNLAAAPHFSSREIELVKSCSDSFFDYLEVENPKKELAAQVALSIAATAFVAIINQTDEKLTYRTAAQFFQNISINLHLELTKYLSETQAKDPSP